MQLLKLSLMWRLLSYQDKEGSEQVQIFEHI